MLVLPYESTYFYFELFLAYDLNIEICSSERESFLLSSHVIPVLSSFMDAFLDPAWWSKCAQGVGSR